MPEYFHVKMRLFAWTGGREKEEARMEKGQDKTLNPEPEP
jgi:hypothetical protein